MKIIEKNKVKYAAFLRGINVGGHHKVPMKQLSLIMKNMGFHNVITILNSGNIVFETDKKNPEKIEQDISENLETVFGFKIAIILVKAEVIVSILNEDPFNKALPTKDLRFYVSFLKNETKTNCKLPITSENKSFKIIKKVDKIVLSTLDLSVSRTPKGLNILEQNFGNQITTRNWNTLKRMQPLLS